MKGDRGISIRQRRDSGSVMTMKIRILFGFACFSLAFMSFHSLGTTDFLVNQTWYMDQPTYGSMEGRMLDQEMNQSTINVREDRHVLLYVNRSRATPRKNSSSTENNTTRFSTVHTDTASKPTQVDQVNLDSNQDVFFLGFKLDWELMDNSTAEFIGQDAFSASWWQNQSNFLRYKKVEEKTDSQEGASFEVFEINEERMRVTRDWMDLNVEHMSKWWKAILTEHDNQDKSGSLKRIIEIFRDYVYSEDRFFLWERLDHTSSGNWLEVSQSTIAVIAYAPYGNYGGENITKWSLAATIMSLVQLGVGRIVVSGPNSQSNETVVYEAWDEVMEATKDWDTTGSKQMTAYGYCNCGNSTTTEVGSSNVPKAALRRLRHVILNMESEKIQRCWAGPKQPGHDGNGMDQWKYVFFGEQDLILNTRPSSLYKLGKALQHGGVLAPHRLQPTPHETDFNFKSDIDTKGFLLPNLPPLFDKVVEIDHYESHSSKENTASSCCDRGINKKPYKQFESCASWWWDCGFGEYKWYEARHGRDAFLALNQTTLLEMHKRLALYPITRLKRGTGVVFVGGESGRLCQPAHGICRKGSVKIE